MKQSLIALMFIGVLFAQDKKDVKAFIMHNIEAGSFDDFIKKWDNEKWKLIK